MKKTLFSVGVVFALAALAAVALTSRPDPAASTTGPTAAQSGADVDTRVVERTVRIKRDSERSAPAAAGAVRAATAPAATAPYSTYTQPAAAGHRDDDDGEHEYEGSGDDHGDLDDEGDDDRASDDGAEHDDGDD